MAETEKAAKTVMVIGGIGIICSFWMMTNAPHRTLEIMYAVSGVLSCLLAMAGLNAWGISDLTA